MFINFALANIKLTSRYIAALYDTTHYDTFLINWEQSNARRLLHTRDPEVRKQLIIEAEVILQISNVYQQYRRLNQA